MKRVLAVVLAIGVALAGCGSSSHATPDATVDAAPTCVAKFSGNFTETDAAADDSCVAFAGGTLTLTVMSTTLDMPLAITIMLGSDAPGSYSSETITMWDATATQTITHNLCLYRAGGDVAPPGDFTLTLTAGDHGTLALDMFIHAPPFTDCGPNPVETLDMTF